MSGTLEIEYLFVFPDGGRKAFNVSLNADTVELNASRSDSDAFPAWTELGFHQCPNCPLSTETTKHCPLAVTLHGAVDFFSEMVSHHRVEVTVTTPERTITVQTTVQKALSSLMGLLMPTSGCPGVAMFKPMARFHLPFSSEAETIYRATSMYLLAQYFRNRDGQDVDLDLTGLMECYRQVEVVNSAVARRILAASTKDASVNAVILLDLFAKALPSAIEDSLEELRPLFQPPKVESSSGRGTPA